MFSGIIEAAIPITSATRGVAGMRLNLELPASWMGEVKLGDSIAVNGCCLTVSALNGVTAAFDVVPETLRLTNLGTLKIGALVNLERALALGERMDGHIVQGHVDMMGRIDAITESDGERRIRIRAGREFCGQCILKGSVCIDGISLTIAELGDDNFTVAIIPHTWQMTNLRGRAVGDAVNLEADMIGKYVRRAMGKGLLKRAS